MRPRPAPEKIEQAETVRLLELLGAAVYVLGTHRPGGRPCPTCRAWVPEHQGTCQTPGLPDLLVFLPGPVRPILFIEQKAAGGRLSPPQVAFQDLVRSSSATHVSGTAAEVTVYLEHHGLLRRGARGAGIPRSVWEG